MHAAAFAATIAISPSKNFSHHSSRIQGTGDTVSMASMSAREEIRLAYRRASSHSNRFHTYIKMRCSGNQSDAVEIKNRALERTNQHHLAVPFQTFLCRKLQNLVRRIIG